MGLTVRQLQPADAPAYTTLRREMLADSPWAFASSPGDDSGLDPEWVAARLAESGQAIVGAYDQRDGRPALVGAAGLYRDRHIKLAHRARIWGVYVTPIARGHGVGACLLNAALDIARSWPGITSAALSVSERSPEARRLYERFGFRAWGVEPRASIVDGHVYDEIHMVTFFDAENRGGVERDNR